MPITFFAIADGEELLSMQLRQELINGMGVIMLSKSIPVKVFWVKAKSHLLFAFWVSLMLHTIKFTQLVGSFTTVMTSSVIILSSSSL